MRHLLEIRRELLPVTEQVRVVELEIDDVLDAVVELALFRMAVAMRRGLRAPGARRGADHRRRCQGGDCERGNNDPCSPLQFALLRWLSPGASNLEDLRIRGSRSTSTSTSNGHPDYAILDNFFQAAFGGSFLNHQWLIAAASRSTRRAPRAERTRRSTRCSTRTGSRRDVAAVHADRAPLRDGRADRRVRRRPRPRRARMRQLRRQHDAAASEPQGAFGARSRRRRRRRSATG